jgi:hypothetical protein
MYMYIYGELGAGGDAPIASGESKRGRGKVKVEGSKAKNQKGKKALKASVEGVSFVSSFIILYGSVAMSRSCSEALLDSSDCL